MLTSLLVLTLARDPIDLPNLGTNLTKLTLESTQWPFANVVKSSSGWVGKDVKVDANGELTSGQDLKLEFFVSGHNPIGQYVLTYTGTAEFEGGKGCSVAQNPDGSLAVTVEGSEGFELKLKSFAPASPPRNVRLTAPHLASEDHFHPVFLQRMSLYRVLRFADWAGTDNCREAEWTDRTGPTSFSFAAKGSVPYEDMFQLTNDRSSIPWVCVPHGATDDYVRNLASLAKATLRPDLKIIVEYSNETWNPSFSQSRHMSDQAKSLKLASSADFYARRSREVFKIFRDQMGDRVVRALSVPFWDSDAATKIVTSDNVYRDADLLSIAPYFGAGRDERDPKAEDIDGLVAEMTAEIKGPIRDQFFKIADLASKHGLQLVAYEGGQGLISSDPNRRALYESLNRDPKIGDLYQAFLKAWRDAGGTLFIHKTDCAPYSSSGCFGTIEFQDQDPQKSFKNRALIQYALFPDR
ncbi:MAG: hypothetical protein JNM34_04740 [Chthonomonadaceae bacterium]|nr:hypothetical protein [Chthonomonadaceae bacterium]